MKRFAIYKMEFWDKHNTKSGPNLTYYINVLSDKSNYGWQINKILF